MKIFELVPSPENKVRFMLKDFKSIPKRSGCYILAAFDDSILYIGLSNNLYERFQQHLDDPNKTKPTTDGKAIWFYYLIYDANKLPRLERTWLNQYVNKNGRYPVLNKIESPIG